MVRSWLFQSPGAAAVVVGAVLSMSTDGLLAPVVLPALSLTDAAAVLPAPSPLIVLLAGQAPSMPESASEQAQPMVTSPEYQPAALALVVGVPLRTGATLSMLTGPTVALAMLSALSVAVPSRDWPAPSSASVVVPVQLLMPDNASAQVKLTVTAVLFHPLAFAAGLRPPAIVGAVLSSLTATEPLAVLPSRSVALDVLVTAAVLAVTLSVAGVGPLATPAPTSVALQVIVTLALVQPAAFGAGESAAVTVGPVLSRTYPAVAGLWDWPVQLLALKFGEAAAVTVRMPSPVPAVNGNDHDDFGVVDVWRAECAPVTWTHLVSADVVTVRVRAPPFLAYSAPATLAVPVPPLNDAAVTEDAAAGVSWTRVATSASRVASVAVRLGVLRDAERCTGPPSSEWIATTVVIRTLVAYGLLEGFGVEVSRRRLRRPASSGRSAGAKAGPVSVPRPAGRQPHGRAPAASSRRRRRGCGWWHVRRRGVRPSRGCSAPRTAGRAPPTRGLSAPRSGGPATAAGGAGRVRGDPGSPGRRDSAAGPPRPPARRGARGAAALGGFPWAGSRPRRPAGSRRSPAWPRSRYPARGRPPSTGPDAHAERP